MCRLAPVSLGLSSIESREFQCLLHFLADQEALRPAVRADAAVAATAGAHPGATQQRHLRLPLLPVSVSFLSEFNGENKSQWTLLAGFTESV